MRCTGRMGQITYNQFKSSLLDFGAESLYIEIFSTLKILLHLHEIVEGLYFHYSLSVCLSVCPALFVNKIPAERMNQLGRGFR